MKIALSMILAWSCLLFVPIASAEVITVMAANLSSGDDPTYESPGIRIFQGLNPDVVLIQNFDYKSGNPDELVDTAFGLVFEYCTGSDSEHPNGIVTRYPIISSGQWPNTCPDSQDFAWAVIDIPGDIDLQVVSVHLSPTSQIIRNDEAKLIKTYVQEQFNPDHYIVVGGQLNTGSRTEPAIATFNSFLVADGHTPKDQEGESDTDESRSEPCDWVMPNAQMEAQHTALIIGSNRYPDGLVFDSRVYTPLSDVSPVQSEDSHVRGMTHMAVMKAFSLNAPVLPLATLTTINPSKKTEGKKQTPVPRSLGGTPDPTPVSPKSKQTESPGLTGDGWVLTESDFTRPWIVLRVPFGTAVVDPGFPLKKGVTNGPDDMWESVQGLTHGSNGFLAVVKQEQLQVIHTSETFPFRSVCHTGEYSYRLARSDDGLHWTSSPLLKYSLFSLHELYEIAEAEGRMVIACGRGTGSKLCSSINGVTWEVFSPETLVMKNVSYVNGYMFAMGLLGALLVSENGYEWRDCSQRTAQNNAVAYGNGLWVVVGNTDIFVSPDTYEWTKADVRHLSRSHLSDTQSGLVNNPILPAFRVFFAQGKFYANQFVSKDGLHWDVITDPANIPSAYIGGMFLKFTDDGRVLGSMDALNWTLSTHLTTENPSQYTCHSHPWFIANLSPDVLIDTNRSDPENWFGRAIILIPRP